MELDKKRGAAVRALEALGYTYRNNEWSPAAVTVVPVPLTAEEERPEIHPLRSVYPVMLVPISSALQKRRTAACHGSWFGRFAST